MRGAGRGPVFPTPASSANSSGRRHRRTDGSDRRRAAALRRGDGLPFGQVRDDVAEPVLQAFEREAIQELASPQQSPVGVGQPRFGTNGVPVAADGGDLTLRYLERLPLGEEELVGGGETERQLAAPFDAADRIACEASRPVLG